tara:strand:- start:303 stop:431 length:129 start_codon:yes stop_codon:yes gene_type:complete
MSTLPDTRLGACDVRITMWVNGYLGDDTVEELAACEQLENEI